MSKRNKNNGKALESKTSTDTAKHKSVKLNGNRIGDYIGPIKVFLVSVLITLFPFLFILIVYFFESDNLYSCKDVIMGFFQRSDMLLAIIAISSSSALTNVLCKSHKNNFFTCLCWVIVLICVLYFSVFDEKEIKTFRVIGVFTISLLNSIINIISQVTYEIKEKKNEYS